MRRIANTTELVSELQRLLAVSGSNQPSRTKVAAELEELSARVAMGPGETFGEELEKLQQKFAGEIMVHLYKLLVSTHKSLADEFQNVFGFQNWDYGSIGRAGVNSWSARIWLKDGPLLYSNRTKRDLDGNLLLHVEFAPTTVEVTVEMGNTTNIFKKSYTHNRAQAYTIAWEARDAWSNLLMS